MRRIPLKLLVLAVALAVLSLGAPWFASLGDCREPGCVKESAAAPSFGDFTAPGVQSCPCPSSCETESAGRCAQACDPERGSISGRQPQLFRRGTVERFFPAASVDIAAAAPPAAPARRRAACVPFYPSSAAAPLFIRNRSIIR